MSRLHITIRFFLCLAILQLCCLPGVQAQSAKDSTATGVSSAQFSPRMHPSSWLHQAENILLVADSRLTANLDTGFMTEQFPRLEKDIALSLRDLELHEHHMRIRDLDDLRSQFLQQRKQLDTWRNGVRKLNDSIIADFAAVEALMKDSSHAMMRADSVIWEIYGSEFRMTDSLLARTNLLYSRSLRRSVAIENILNRSVYRVNQGILSVERELRLRNAALYTRTHPPLWSVNAGTYPDGIGTVLVNTVRQNLASLKYYIKNAYIRAILFRVLLLLITLLPIWYFRKNKQQFNDADYNSPYKFVHKYTGASTSSFVLVMAPFIFINAPHIFLEAIIITLAFTTSLIFLKENPGIGKRNMYLLLAVYLVLKVMNLMISVTLFGRILWAFSILGMIPLYGIFRNISKSRVQNHLLFRFIIGLSGLLYLSGWILSLTGHYPLGRILLLTGLDQFFLAIILYVAIYSFIDFTRILADLYNARNRITTIRVELIYRKLLTLVRFLATLFWFWSLILNLNLDEFVRDNLFSILNRQVTIGSYAISPGSILVFFLILYLAFYLSGLLDGLFYDEKRTSESTSKTSLGSIVIMLRLFVLASGFIIGLIIAGIPLNSVGLFFGALGVGIGFGLQGLIGNLISGIIIAFEKPVYVGDIIEVENQRGRVTDIGLRAIKVDTGDGAEYLIPNSTLTGQTMKNWTLTSKQFKVVELIQLDLSNDAANVITILEESLRDMPGILHAPPPAVRLQEITPNALVFTVYCWVSDIIKAKAAQHTLLLRIHQALDAAGIRYPRKREADDID
jgi:small-conductance mechanosensitive channel